MNAKAGLERDKVAVSVLIGPMRDGRKEVFKVMSSYRTRSTSDGYITLLAGNRGMNYMHANPARLGRVDAASVTAARGALLLRVCACSWSTRLGIVGARFSDKMPLEFHPCRSGGRRYRVYAGEAPGFYGSPIDVGAEITWTVTGLRPGSYYVVVTAYSGDRIGSTFSNEVNKTFTE